ncbi:hypothetical protein LTR66_012345, partial [Elasticomyces elasticus]
MLSSLLRPGKGRRRNDKSPDGSPAQARNRDDGDGIDGDVDNQQRDFAYGVVDQDIPEEDDGDEEQDEEGNPLLPIFSSAHLDNLPLYNITHSVRILIIQKCETILSWDQLRSPQVSQFLVKPIQQQIRANHFSRATLSALISNCLQFQKEGQANPGNVGVCKTRAMLAEMLAMRLMKEFTTRELIDALSYDFDPLQGLTPPGTGTATPGPHDLLRARTQARGARISTVEIAIRAQAKRFLAHPLVVQQLEAIWAGTIVFHSSADNLHRRSPKPQKHRPKSYGALQTSSASPNPETQPLLHKQDPGTSPSDELLRRTVTLYDPRDASLFKLSRLRVPRYRQLFSTLSYAVMLGLFLAVLIDRSLEITALEVVFWFWSAGYMLDEVVGFTEQGFGLYIMSVWNAFDLGILLLFITYYVLRLYGIIMPDVRKHHVANMAYDVLASTAVLLFPRLFSVLDHYRYFSQLLIAFRMMAQDLVAILILIIISCSGFFVAFTLSFSDEDIDGNGVAYALFQILMGFTPAAWDKWGTYNVLGKAIMSMFLIICHFLIVTILITVLTNSFLAISQNANEEHQFLFAVNTISMVKSDALFSYIAPTNVIGWVLSPFRYIIAFRQFVKLNRTVIKITHFPVLFVIFAYERLILSRMAYDPTDLIEKQGRSTGKMPAFSLAKGADLFSPGRRLREPSVISFHKDRALDEVFRRPFHGSTMRTTQHDMDPERRNSANVVDTWMQNAENEGGAISPLEQPRSILERLETRRPKFRRSHTAGRMQTFKRDFSFATRSALSDPEDQPQRMTSQPHRIDEEPEYPDMGLETLPQDTGADGDDELPSHEEADADMDAATPDEPEITPGMSDNIHATPDSRDTDKEDSEDEYFQMTIAARAPGQQVPDIPSSATRARLLDATDLDQARSLSRSAHNRNFSSNTMIFSPLAELPTVKPAPSVERLNQNSRAGTTSHTNSVGTVTPAPANVSKVRPPMRSTNAVNIPKTARARPAMPSRQQNQTAPNKDGLLGFGRQTRRAPSFNAIALDLASDLGDNRFGVDFVDVGGISGMPASFSEQIAREREQA